MAPAFKLVLQKGRTIPQPIGATGISFAAPGLEGELTVEVKSAPAADATLTRSSLRDSSEIASPDSVDGAIEEIGGLTAFNLETKARTPVVSEAEGVRSGTDKLANDEAILNYKPRPDEYSFVVYQDEAGAISLHFPEGLSTAKPESSDVERATRDAGNGLQHYRIQLRTPAPPPPPQEGERQTRFGLAAIGKKLLKLVVGKIIKKAAGPLVSAADYGAVWLWESKARAFEGFHGGPDANTLLAENPVALNSNDWAALNSEGKKSLLFIHGTTSTTSGAFSGLLNFPAQAELYKRYEGRVIGFNHHTLTKSVAGNAADFYAGLPGRGTYTFDIVCHSRGGLVARALKELTPAQLSTATNSNCACSATFKIGKIIFVGTPNIGTPLADPSDIPDSLELLSNIAAWIPGAGLTLAGILSSAAFVAENGFRVLPGMRNMDPADAFLKEINLPGPPGTVSPLGDYFAIQSNFDLNGVVNTVLLKGLKYLFKGNLNDVIVPTLGVSNIDGTTLPDKVTKYYGAPPLVESVAHTQYFQQEATWKFIDDNLP
ncbi:MAG TPA: alpha/beta hydrolase [Candidatus Dormibacteraeota bacterium]|nr:alpha/beta hydrolase [Candidatus Dormibacteraeota bacterium]